MNTNIEDHAGGAHTLSVQHTHAVTRILQVAQFLHEALGVQRPALTVTGNPQHVRAPGVHGALQSRGDSNLQVVARNTLVVHGGGFTPGSERVLTLGNRPPHAARTREIGGGAGVVNTTLVRGRNATLNAAHGAANFKVSIRQVLHRGVGELLHPRLQLIGAVQLTCRILIEQLLRTLNACARLNLLGNLTLTSNNALQLLHAPGVGLVQVNGGAQERTGVQAVRLTAHSVAGGSDRLQLLHQVAVEAAVAFLRSLGTGDSLILQSGDSLGDLSRQIIKETTGSVVRGGLLNDNIHLAARGNLTLFTSRLKSLDVSLQCLGDAVHTPNNMLPILLGVALHQVEDRAHFLRDGRNIVQLPAAKTSLVLLAVQAQTLLQSIQGDQVNVINRQDVIDLLQSLLRKARKSLLAGGRVIGVQGLYALTTKLGCMDGVQVEDLFKVFVSNLIDVGQRALQSVDAGKFLVSAHVHILTQGCASNHDFR